MKKLHWTDSEFDRTYFLLWYITANRWCQWACGFSEFSAECELEQQFCHRWMHSIKCWNRPSW